MIRLRRNSAPADQQGRAFGTLEFIRDIAEGLTTTGLLVVFTWVGSSQQALSTVVVQLSLVTMALGVIHFVLPGLRSGPIRAQPPG